jgi:predicted nucleotidyltransferase
MKMLSTQDRAKIKDIAQRYGVGQVLLFGSSIDDRADTRDIDLAVEGLAPSRFFSFYADLIFSLSKPVDLVDMGRKSRFTDIIRQEGVSVYG